MDDLGNYLRTFPCSLLLLAGAPAPGLPVSPRFPLRDSFCSLFPASLLQRDSSFYRPFSSCHFCLATAPAVKMDEEPSSS